MPKFEIIAEGLRFPEGPIAFADGSLLVVEIARGTLTRIAGGRADVVANHSYQILKGEFANMGLGMPEAQAPRMMDLDNPRID